MQSACAVLYGNLLRVCSYHTFPHHLQNCTIFEKKKVIERKMYILIFFTF